MKTQFVETSNVSRFLAAIRQVESRAVAEKQIVVVTGEAGFGKSRTALWWGVHNSAVMISVFPLASPVWVLRDLVRELGDAPKRSAEDVKLQVVGLLAAEPRPIVVDEVEHALERGAVALDALRVIADLCEVPFVLVGREGTREKLRRHKQIWRRLSPPCEFKALTLGDVRDLAAALAEAEIGDEVIAAIHANCEGRICTALAGIAAADKAAARSGRPARLADIDRTELAHPWVRGEVTGLAAERRRRAAS
jgi:DNA transposition AAA+ family ATPase